MRAFGTGENKLLAAGNDRPTDGHRRLVDVNVDIIADEHNLEARGKHLFAMTPQYAY